MDEALPHAMEHEDYAISEGNGVTHKDFFVCLVKTLIFHVVSSIACIIYTILRKNNTFLMFVFIGIIPLWSGILVFSVALPVVSPIRGRPWWQCAFWVIIIILPPLSVVLAPMAARASDVCWSCEETLVGQYLYSSIIHWVAACMILWVTYVLRAIRLRLKAFHNHDYDKLRWVAMQCIDSTLRTGVLQIAVLATALVAFGKRTEDEVWESANLVERYEERLGRVKDGYFDDRYCKDWPDGIDYSSEYQQANIEYFAERYGSNDRSSPYWFCYPGGAWVDWYATTFKDKHEQDTTEALHGMQAGFAGLAINMFLFQALMARHVLKLGLVDAMKGRMTWMECLSALLQLVMVVTVAVLVTFSPSEFSRSFTPPEGFDEIEIGKRRILMWLLLGLVVPIFLSLLLNLFFAKALQDDNSRTGKIFRDRHRRVTRVDYQIMKGEEQQAALKQDFEGHKNQMDGSLTDLESKISSLGDEISSLGDDVQQQAHKMEISLRGQLDGSLTDLEHRISSLGDEIQKQAGQMEQSFQGRLDGSLTDLEYRISSLGNELQQHTNHVEQSLQGRLGGSMTNLVAEEMEEQVNRIE